MGTPEKDMPTKTKAETYETRAFIQIMSSLYKLESKGVLADDYRYNAEKRPKP